MTQDLMPLTIYNQSLALMTDFYQLTMAYGYWRSGLDKKEAVFHHSFRKPPFGGGFTIAAGLESLIRHLENFRFDSSDLAYLEKLKMENGKPFFSSDFLDYLGGLKFSCDVHAVPEGTAVFPYEPLLRIQGPIIQCQLLESPILNLLNFPTIIATKAARISIAAKGDSVLEFGLRRAQGIDGALTASRASFIGGCDSTSNVLAGKMFGIPVKGTMAHSWVMAFEDELTSFQVYAESLPDNCIFLVDTYHSLEGVKKAIEVGRWLEKQGKKLVGIRLDSGDLAALSIKSRKMLDEAGFQDAKIVASNELDETLISELKRQGAKIDVWGVGTHLVTAKDHPALDGVYKISAIRDCLGKGDWKYKLKLSEQMVKISNPGILQVRRYYAEENIADAIFDLDFPPKEKAWIIDPLDPTKQKVLKKGLKYKDLLVPIFRGGKRVYEFPSLKQIQAKTKEELACFDACIKRFLNPHHYFVGMEKSLYDMKIDLVKKIRSQVETDFIEKEEA